MTPEQSRERARQRRQELADTMEENMRNGGKIVEKKNLRITEMWRPDNTFLATVDGMAFILHRHKLEDSGDSWGSLVYKSEYRNLVTASSNTSE